MTELSKLTELLDREVEKVVAPELVKHFTYCPPHNQVVLRFCVGDKFLSIISQSKIEPNEPICVCRLRSKQFKEYRFYYSGHQPKNELSLAEIAYYPKGSVIDQHFSCYFSFNHLLREIKDAK